MQWSNLGKIVYARTYSRKDSGKLENWEETVERAVRGNVSGHNVPEAEIRDLLKFAKERKGGFAGRGYWFSGSPAHRRIGGVALNNCLAGQEKFITKEYGVVSFADVVGETVTVLTNNGWEKAPVRSFGLQRVHDITFRPANENGKSYRSNLRHVVRATLNHGWLLANGDKTRNLAVGDVVISNKYTCISHNEDYNKGFIHGLIFGDGSLTYKSQAGMHRYQIRLCTPNKQTYSYLFEDVTYPEHANGDPVGRAVFTYDAKLLPTSGVSPDYITGFLAGWITADGNISDSKGTRLSSQTPEAMQWLKDNAPLGGYVLTGYSYNTSKTNYGTRANPLITFCLSTNNVTWKVETISVLDDVEEVFCVTVPKAGSFTLAGGIYSLNCWYLNASDWQHYVIAQDLLMLGGGVGLSVEHKFTSKLPKVKKGVTVEHRGTKDADFIIPDSREGWCELTRRTLESFFVTGRSFTYSTVCLRGYGEAIAGFGGIASGPIPLIEFIRNISASLREREGKHIRPIDAADIMTSIGQMVVAGNVRRSAIIILGDCWDKEYLKSKRWDLQTLPTHRARANYSVVCDDVEDLHPLFWKTYEMGEPFGIVNRKAIQKYGRMGELMKDTAEGVNPCAEATLENGEPCNLLEIALCNLKSIEEFERVARLCFRAGKRVTCEAYHHELCDEVVKRNRRVGVGITGCLSSPLFAAESLDRVYNAILAEDREYSKHLGVPTSIRHTVVKPSGTMGKVLDCNGEEGIHAALAPYIIQRVQFAANDKLIPALRAAGHSIEPLKNFDGSVDPRTLVSDFYVAAPEGAPTVEGGWDMWKQLETLKMAQKHWADQAVSVTVYYKPEELPQLKEWLANNLDEVKSISFLKYSGHGFVQAPKEPITKEEYERLSAKIKPLDESLIGNEGDIGSFECESGSCPIK